MGGFPPFFKEKAVGPVRIVGVVLIVAGVLAVALGGFSFTKESEKARIGPLSLTVKEKENVNIPLWAGLGITVLGVVLVAVGGRKG